MNTSNIMANLIKVAETIAPLVPMGTQGMAAGKAVLNLINDFRETSGATPDKIAEYDAARETLEKAVNDHADRTAASLGD